MTRPVPKPPPSTSPLRAAIPVQRVMPSVPAVDPVTLITSWNHACPRTGCRVWVPNHRHDCGGHGGAR